jgi:hypothetical protein
MLRLSLATKRTGIALAVLLCLAFLVRGFISVASDFGAFAAFSIFFPVLLPPFVVATHLWRRCHNVQGREVAYAAILACFCLGAIIFVVRDWYAKGMHRQHAEDLQWSQFERLIRRDPAFGNVQITLTDRKHIYYVEGTVPSREDLERLKSLASRCGIERERLDGPFVHSVSLTIAPQRTADDSVTP